MQTLIIGPHELKKALDGAVLPETDITWVDALDGALNCLESEDIDSIIYDTRTLQGHFCTDLKKLLSELPVTTRVLAIVEHLPEDEIFSASGVVYLTPPVQVSDIGWFIKSSHVAETG